LPSEEERPPDDLPDAPNADDPGGP
jgi:hypothetical protein